MHKHTEHFNDYLHVNIGWLLVQSTVFLRLFQTRHNIGLEVGTIFRGTGVRGVSHSLIFFNYSPWILSI